MASTVTLREGSAVLRITGFEGLWQKAGDWSGSAARAAEAENALTRDGALMPMAKCLPMAAELPGKIGTLCRLSRRWGEERGEIFIAASGGRLYWSGAALDAWHLIPMPEGFGEAFESDRWSSVSYEINEEGSEHPVDVLLLSNEKDGMICVRGDTKAAVAVETPKKFGVIARYAERVWGGAIEEDPDMLVYSAPYDPFDWEENPDIPEDGAGDIQQPSWDGDSFQALVPFGSQLVAIKKNRVWRVLGTNPGEYSFREQYGGGTVEAGTVAAVGTDILMLGRKGVCRYDGESVSPFQREALSGLWERIASAEGSRACWFGEKYYLAVPLDGAEGNNAVIVYDPSAGNWFVRSGVRVESFLAAEGKMYFTSSETPGKVWVWREDPFTEGGGAESLRWVSGWMDLGCRERRKTAFELYFQLEAKGACRVTVSLETEKLCRSRSVTLRGGEGEKACCLRFEGGGRLMRLRVESDTETPWRVVGGMTVVAETESD